MPNAAAARPARHAAEAGPEGQAWGARCARRVKRLRGIDVAAIGRISAVPSLLKVICQNTGMGFAAVARVTDGTWTACAVQDTIQFGLKPGGQLEVETTLCSESRMARQPGGDRPRQHRPGVLQPPHAAHVQHRELHLGAHHPHQRRVLRQPVRHRSAPGRGVRRAGGGHVHGLCRPDRAPAGK
jgi:hypothetical protein